MDKQEILDALNALSERDIAILLYRNLDCSANEIISYRKGLTVHQVYEANKKLKKILEHDEMIAALQVVFCLE
jgi:hypothetical protein